MSEPRGPARSVFDAALLICVACVLLYVGAQLLKAIWPWLLAGLIITGVLVGAGVWWRWRRSRW